MLKIGIMGGTFNPVHNGHLKVAREAKEQFGLDKILFITGGNPPHKKKQVVLDKIARHKMVELAISGIDDFELCDYEIKKEKYSYSFETLRYLKKEYKDAKLYFIIGSDSFCDITKWKNPRMIMEMCTLLVYGRSGYDAKKKLEEISKTYYCNVKFIKSEPVDISSTQIRKDIFDFNDVSTKIPLQVYNYIKRNNLYAEDNRPLKKKLRDVLTAQRFVHSVGVSMTAIDLAKHYGENEEKAYVAGLLHDCAKNFSDAVMEQKCIDYDVILDEYEKENPFLVHARVGAKVASVEYGIRDKEIIEAIDCHTLGKVGMCNLSKIIFIADMIEPERSYPGVDEIRQKAYENLDLAIEACIEATISFSKEKNRKVHPRAFEVLKWVRKNKGK